MLVFGIKKHRDTFSKRWSNRCQIDTNTQIVTLFFISLFMLLLDMDKKVDLRKFISTLQNRTNEKGKGVVLRDEGKPVAVVMAYEDYLELIKIVGEE